MKTRTPRTTKRRKALHRANLMLCFLVILIVMGYSLVNHLFDSLSDVNGERAEQLVSYKIGSGDTLWRIASKVVTADEDVRDKIIAIQKINKLNASQSLTPGQVIQIPLVKATIENYQYTFNVR